jgi:hypothetical protein
MDAIKVLCLITSVGVVFMNDDDVRYLHPNATPDHRHFANAETFTHGWLLILRMFFINTNIWTCLTFSFRTLRILTGIWIFATSLL